MALTYEEWKAKGYQVQKGSKAVGFTVTGKGLFGQHQVKQSKGHYRADYVDEGDWYQEDYDMWYDSYGYTRDWA